MIPLTLAEIALATDGRLDAVDDPQTAVTGPVVVDSREAAPGGLFIALPGEHHDGHEFAAAAIAQGAVAVIAERPVGVPAVVVENSQRAFAQIARAVMDKVHGLTVVGITGSSGKTSTKDLLAQVLEPLGPLVAPPGSYNNEVGVPLTACRVDQNTRTLIVEMGARGIAHISYLCGITPPTIGVVLNVGSAHLGEFGDRDTIARAKAELIEALPETGIAVLNADDQVVRRMAEKTAATVLMVGESVHADVRAEEVRVDGTGRASFTLVTPEANARVSLKMIGEHQVANALAVAGVAHALGMTTADIAARLSQAERASRWRMEVTVRPDGVTIVNDAYNANPESVRAALKTLVVMGRSAAASPEGSGSGRSFAASPEGSGSGRTWAVLGEMRELGESSVAEHDAIGRLAVRLNVAKLVAVGDGARAIHQGALLEGSWDGESEAVPDIDAAAALLERELRPGDIVLVKSSHAAGLRHLGDRLAGVAP